MKFFQLFAPTLYQRGSDEEGIFGFLIQDIKKEAKRVMKLKCFYCHSRQANLGCCVKECPKAYHIDCALKEHATFDFSGHFPTYCSKHSKFKIPDKVNFNNCGICMEKIGKMHAILIPCCKNSWFHQSCLQKYAYSSGVYFKCPLCNDINTLKEKLPEMGIFLPEKDADWEFDYSAYQNLNETPDKICDAENCQHPTSDTQWKLCSTCGASSIHLQCMASDDDFVCRSCTDVLNRTRIAERESDQELSHENRQDEERENLVMTPKRKESSSEEEDSPIRRPKKKKPKFVSWFSDDELLNPDSDEDEIFETPKRRKLQSM